MLKLNFEFCVFVPRQHGRPLTIMRARVAVLCGVMWLLHFFTEMHSGNLNSCFVHYVAVLLPQSHGCHGLLSRSFPVSFFFFFFCSAKSH